MMGNVEDEAGHTGDQKQKTGNWGPGVNLQS